MHMVNTDDKFDLKNASIIAHRKIKDFIIWMKPDSQKSIRSIDTLIKTRLTKIWQKKQQSHLRNTTHTTMKESTRIPRAHMKVSMAGTAAMHVRDENFETRVHADKAATKADELNPTADENKHITRVTT